MTRLHRGGLSGATAVVTGAVLLIAAPVAGAQAPANLPPPRVIPLAARVLTLTPRVISVAPQKTAPNTFKVSADVLFAFDSSTLSPNAQAVLSSVVKQLRTRHSGTVSVLGYTDSIGKPSYNLSLSRRRADAVRAFLEAKVGVPALTYRARGFGEADPVAPNTLPNGQDNPAGRRQNRRVVIVYKPG